MNAAAGAELLQPIFNLPDDEFSDGLASPRGSAKGRASRRVHHNHRPSRELGEQPGILTRILWQVFGRQVRSNIVVVGQEGSPIHHYGSGVGGE